MQSASSCESGRLVYAIQALLLGSCASVPEQAGILHRWPRFLVLHALSQLGQALSGATASTWQLATASMDPKNPTSIRHEHLASRSARPADRSVF